MAYRRVELAPNETYHVYNRGTDKRVIYQDGRDYQRFLELMYLSNNDLPVRVNDTKKYGMSSYEVERSKPLVSIGAYCLMPNHFHILLQQHADNGISKFMQKLSTGYTMYFNKRYKRTGTLFEGVFKSQHAGKDEYLKYLFAYIHLNPVKLIQKDWKERGIEDAGKALDHAGSYRYSSRAGPRPPLGLKVIQCRHDHTLHSHRSR